MTLMYLVLQLNQHQRRTAVASGSLADMTRVLNGARGSNNRDTPNRGKGASSQSRSNDSKVPQNGSAPWQSARRSFDNSGRNDKASVGVAQVI